MANTTNKNRPEDRPSQRAPGASSAVDKAKDVGHNLADKAGDLASSVGQKVSDAASNVGQRQRHGRGRRP